MVPQNATTASIDFVSPELGSTISSLCRTATNRGAAKTVPLPPPAPLLRRSTLYSREASPLSPSDKPVAFWYIAALLAQPAHRIVATQKKRNDLSITGFLPSEPFSPSRH